MLILTEKKIEFLFANQLTSVENVARVYSGKTVKQLSSKFLLPCEKRGDRINNEKKNLIHSLNHTPFL